MLRKIVCALFLALIVGAPVVSAQGVPGGPVPDHQRGQPSTPQAQPPRSALPDWVLHGAYNGPSPKAPAGTAVPQNPEQAAQIARGLQDNPAVQAAVRAARPAVEASRALGQRIFQNRTLPSGADLQHGKGYTLQPRRSGSPLDGLLNLLSAESAPAAPDDEPSLQPVDQGGIVCYIWVNLVGGQIDQWQDEYMTGQGLNYCPNDQNVGGAIRYMSVSMHIYKCSAYFTYFDICLAPYHYYELWPPCEQASTNVPYLWCGPRAFYPGQTTGAFFLRNYGYTELWSGGFGGDYRDSHNVPYHCAAGGIGLC